VAAESGKKSAKCACIEEGSRIVPKSVSEALGRYHKCQMPVQSCLTSRKAEVRLATESGVINAAGRSTGFVAGSRSPTLRRSAGRRRRLTLDTNTDIKVLLFDLQIGMFL